MSKTWIYHRTEEPMMVEGYAASEYYKQGWADTPAAFLNNEIEKEIEHESIERKTDEPGTKRETTRKRQRMLTNDDSE